MINIVEKKECCGCSACVQACPKHCIELHPDEEGFLYPKFNTSVCIDCGLCERVCPILKSKDSRKPLSVYAAINTDEKIRYESSSGGVFTALAETIIKENGVVFGAKFDKDWNVVHDYTDTIDGLKAFRGSKYVQSTIGRCFEKVKFFLDKGTTVMFSGTPCQISGLIGYLKKDYPNLITIDIACYGVPSPRVWKDYLDEIRQPDNNTCNIVYCQNTNNTLSIEKISFRDKQTGWKRYNFVVKFAPNETINEATSSCYTANELRSDASNNLYMMGFLNNFYLRPSCYDCHFRCGKSGSDIKLADFWGIQNVKPEIDDDKGISLILVNSSKGQKLISKTEIKLYDSNYEDAYNGNHALEQNPSYHKVRDFFWKEYERSGIKAILLAYNKNKPSIIKYILVRLYAIFKSLANRMFK